MIKILLGGSPCTYWSIAQKNNRETEPSGMGWELFENYLIAKEKFQPDIFLYENNKSAAQPIKDEIKKRLNVWDGTLLMPDSGTRYIEINSALVSAQNRQRFYVHNCGDVQQPKDRGILLRDIWESGVDISQNEKAYCLTASYSGAIPQNTIERSQRTMVAEPVCVQEQVFGRKASADGSYDRRYEARTDGKSGSLTATNRQNAIAEPINDSQGKSRTIKSQYAKNGMANFITNGGHNATAVAVRIPEYSTEKSRPLTASYSHKGAGEGSLVSDCFPKNPNKQVFDYIAEPVRIGTIENNAKNGDYDSKQYRVYSPDGKSTTLCGQGSGVGAKTGLYACPCKPQSMNGIDNVGEAHTIQKALPGLAAKYGYIPEKFNAYNLAEIKEKSPTLSTGSMVTSSCATTLFCPTDRPVYEVKDGQITIKGKQYPIKLADGYYIIRKLTVTECCRLQGMPDWWFLDNEGNKILSDSQAYKGLGNGWQLDTVKYILEHGLKNVPRNEELIVLSLYDGIATGRRILEELGFAKVKYYAYEIDKYCIKLTSYRYPDIIHCGDAFKIRNKGEIEKII